VTAYALGIAVGGSLITAWPAREPRKRLLALMTLFVAGNLACGLAPSFAVLLVARVATSFSHAAFAGAGIALAISSSRSAVKARRPP
jgi:DHA1 family inner membrane transport protein